MGEVQGDHGVIALTLGWLAPEGRARGVMTLVRPSRPFTEEDRELLSSLAAQATLALENVELHYHVRRQAVTDELTGLANHGRFQEMLGTAIEQSHRYRRSVGLIMLDVDNFKSVNDTCGHQQGDLVLMEIAAVLRADHGQPRCCGRRRRTGAERVDRRGPRRPVPSQAFGQEPHRAGAGARPRGRPARTAGVPRGE